MALINSDVIPASATAYEIEQSLRFNDDDSAYLSWTPSSAGNRKTWTWSGWAKRSNVSANGVLFAARTGVDATYFNLSFQGSGDLRIESNLETAYPLYKTNALFRDPSAWYHVVLAVDMTQATSTNRVKLYVNDVLQTTASYNVPAQNTDLNVNSTATHLIGQQASGNYLDGYLTEINFIDGQQLDPSYFGETDVITGAWIPKQYTGTYGTNGFYLNFSNNSSTTALGYDQSSNSNNWTTNNISLSAGSTYDSMTDVPALTSEDAGNFCTLSPINPTNGAGTQGDLYDGNLRSGTTVGRVSVGTIAIPSSGKFYFEMYLNGGVTTTGEWGLMVDSRNRSLGEITYTWQGEKRIDGSASSYGASVTNGDYIGFAINRDSNQVTFYKNNVSQGTISYTFKDNVEYLPWAYNGDGRSYIYNFGQRPFNYTPPTGYKKLNTYNLPDPGIKKSQQYFNPVLYTGNGSSGHSITGVGFQPDVVWIKARSYAEWHALHTSTIGTGKFLKPMSTDSEVTNRPNCLTSFDSDGFTVGNEAVTNSNGATYVAWNWKANGSSGSTNTAGSITSSVSVDTTGGFSIVKYTGTGSAATVGHGLGVAPKMIICKVINQSSDWPVYHVSCGATAYLNLNEDRACTTNSAPWNNTAPTSSVFTVGTSYGTNWPGGNLVAYCFASVEGFSAFGRYLGNGNSNGTYVYTGFAPAVVISKKSGPTVGDWQIQTFDSPGYNVVTKTLFTNNNIAEATNPNLLVDFDSNGFKWRATSGNTNGNGDTFIYAAFAESPFKYSLAR